MATYESTVSKIESDKRFMSELESNGKWGEGMNNG